MTKAMANLHRGSAISDQIPHGSAIIDNTHLSSLMALRMVDLLSFLIKWEHTIKMIIEYYETIKKKSKRKINIFI